MRAAVLTLCLAAVTAVCGRDPAPADTPAAPAAVPAAASVEPVRAAAPTDPATTITPEGLGAVRIGMTQAEALAALGEGWTADAPLDDAPGSCRTIGQGSPDARNPVYLMVEEGRVSRVSVDGSDGARTSPVRSAEGIGIGSTAADVRRVYGDRVQAEGHRYLGPAAQYLTIWTRGAPASETAAAAPDARGIRFVTGDDGRVQEIHAGGPSILYVEGCA